MRNMTSEQVAAASGGAILCLLLLLFRLLLVAVTHSPSIDLFNDVLLAIYLFIYLSLALSLLPLALFSSLLQNMDRSGLLPTPH